MISGNRYCGVYPELWRTTICLPVFLALTFIVFLVFGSVPNLATDWAKLLWSIFSLATVFAIFWVVARLVSLAWDRSKQGIEDEFAAREK